MANPAATQTSVTGDTPNIGVGETTPLPSTPAGLPSATDSGAQSFALPDVSGTTGGAASPASDIFGGIDGTATSSDSSSTSGLNSLLTSLESGLTGGAGLGTAIGSAIPYAGIYGAASVAATNQQNANAATVAPLTNLGNQLTGAGTTQLNNFQNNTITPQQQSVADTANSQGASLISSAGALGQIAQQAFSQYSSGALNPGDQAALDAQVTSQKAQVAQQMAAQGITDSSAINSAYQQIDNNALIQRQTLMNNYLSTGETAYNSWATTTEAGQQLQLEGKQYVASSIQQNLTNALSLDQAGMGPLEDAINATIQSNTQISNTMTQLMASLAAAWSYQTAKASGVNTSTGTGTGSTASQIGSAVTAAKNVSPNTDGSIFSGANTTSGINSVPSENLTDDQVFSSGNSISDPNALNGAIGDDFSSATSAVDAASGVADDSSDIGSFSSGSAAAGTTLSDVPAENLTDSEIIAGVPSTDLSNVSSNIPAANFSSGVGSDLGAAGSIYGAVENPSNPAGDVQAAGGAAKLVNAGLSAAGEGTSDALTTVGQAAGPIAAGVGLAYQDYQMLDPANIPDTDKGTLAGATTGKLPSGNSLLEYNGVGVGLGTQQTQGSGEIYNTNETNASGQPTWIGQANSGTLENDYDEIAAAKSGVATGESVSALDTATTKTNSLLGGATYTTNAGVGIAAQAAAADAQVKTTPAQQQQVEQDAENSALQVFNETGGAAAWGQSSTQWMQSMFAALSDVGQGTEFGRTS